MGEVFGFVAGMVYGERPASEREGDRVSGGGSLRGVPRQNIEQSPPAETKNFPEPESFFAVRCK